MADIKISELNSAGALDGTEVIALVQGDETKKTTIDTGSQVKANQDLQTTDDVEFNTVSTTEVQATTSAGLIVKNNSGGSVITAGAGGGTGVTVAGGLICSTINTGDGAFEIGQNLRTSDDVEFSNITGNGKTFTLGSTDNTVNTVLQLRGGGQNQNVDDVHKIQFYNNDSSDPGVSAEIATLPVGSGGNGLEMQFRIATSVGDLKNMLHFYFSSPDYIVDIGKDADRIDLGAGISFDGGATTMVADQNLRTSDSVEFDKVTATDEVEVNLTGTGNQRAYTIKSPTGLFSIQCDSVEDSNPTWTFSSFSNEEFSFMQNGSEALRIVDGGISFDGGTNVLGDYEEEVSYNPEFRFVTVSSYTTQTGTYTRIGNQIFVDFEIEYSGLDTTDTSNIHITLPISTADNKAITVTINTVQSTGFNFSSSDTINGIVGNNIDLRLYNNAGTYYTYNGGKINASGIVKGKFQYTVS